MAQIRIGCSGWAYKDWKGAFYPKDLKDKDRLAFYAGRFDTCEINASFYRLPSEAAVAAWAEAAPDGFVYAWKISRYLSHNKKLNDPADSMDLVFGRMSPLGVHEGPALLQLPPMLHRNDERLEGFLSRLPKRTRCTVEFRHASWYDPAVFALLERHGASLCISDHHDAPSPWEATAPFVYIRGHGPGGRYHGRYGEAELQRWATHIRGWNAEGRDVYAYFDNDIKAAAPADAVQLKALLGLA
jgi:uncharacterized protein YecE (DUF72 family)